MYIAIGIILLIVVLILIGNKSVHHEIIVNATPEEIWSVLMNTDSYNQWNPVMKLLEGEVREGNKVKYQFTQDAKNVSNISSNVKKIIPNKLLNQEGGISFIITFNHRYILEPTVNGTKLIIHEDYTGIYVNFWNPKAVGVAYGRLSEAIKLRVEKLK